MTRDVKLVLGAVAYDPKVVTIWDGFKEYFAEHGLPFDYVLFSQYEQQVEALMNGEIQVAWNSPLAWIRAKRMGAAQGTSAQAVVMRDSDQDLVSVVVTRRDSGIASVSDLRGRCLGVGAVDSPQATLLPLSHLRRQGLVPGDDFEVRHHGALAGKHGDHIGGERDAMRALLAGDVDAACVVDANHLLFLREGTVAPGTTVVVTETEPYDHCNFTTTAVAAGKEMDRFVSLLLGMSYSDAKLRQLFDLEGLTEWRPARTSKYARLEQAVDETGFYDASGAITAADYRY